MVRISEARQKELIEAQDERNRRLNRFKRKKAKKIAEKGVSRFVCNQCKKIVHIPWRKLGAETPRCRKCNFRLVILAACLNEGVLPTVR